MIATRRSLLHERSGNIWVYLREQMQLGFASLYPTYRLSGMPIAVFNQSLMECLPHCAPLERVNWHFAILQIYRSAGAGTGGGDGISIALPNRLFDLH